MSASDHSRLAPVPEGPVEPRGQSVLAPLGVSEVRLDGGFWGERQELNRTAIIPHCAEWVERLGWIQNFLTPTARQQPQRLFGHPDDYKVSSDSDVYKLIEALSWETGRVASTELDALLDRIVGALETAQEPDGYLNTFFGHRGEDARYTDLQWGLELYCYGHLIQAGIASLRTHGSDRLVELVRRVADHVCETFGPGRRDGIDGHSEIEMALVELYRATGEKRYLDQAAWFVQRHGHGWLGEGRFGAAYYQDDVPARDAHVFNGHAVRALYFACAVVDVAVETDDTELLAAVERQWERTIGRRTYITGGMGSRHEDEAYGEDWELPPDRAYAETCAGIAALMLSWRLLLATGDARYSDFAERVLYNIVATSPGADGKSFFYTNTLHRRTKGVPSDMETESARAEANMRAAWFGVPCCPTNIARTIASLSGYVATRDCSGLQLHQYIPGRISTRWADEQAISLRIVTNYPSDGRITVVVDEAPDSPWVLALRVPAWASGASLVVDGTRRPAMPGYERVERLWRRGDEVILELPLEPRWTWPNPSIDAIRGSVAVERGPLVYCLESLANDLDLERVAVDTGQPLIVDGDVIHAAGLGWQDGDEHWPYGKRPSTAMKEVPLLYTPYHNWGKTGATTMRIWVLEQGGAGGR